MKNRIVGSFIRGSRTKIKIKRPCDIRKGQRVAVYLPTAEEIKNSNTHEVVGYKNDILSIAKVEQDGNQFFVTIKGVERNFKISKETRQKRKLPKGDVIIKKIAE